MREHDRFGRVELSVPWHDRPRKEAITIVIDAEVLAWFKNLAAAGRGYQSEIDLVLRRHVAARAEKQPS
ncbi:MAG: BrnA antitoxin family protein [Acetobacteraceae bacterium]